MLTWAVAWYDKSRGDAAMLWLYAIMGDCFIIYQITEAI